MPRPADGPRKAALMPILRSLALAPPRAPAPRGSTPPRAGAWAHAVRRARPRPPPPRNRRRWRPRKGLSISPAAASSSLLVPPLAERAQKSGRIEQRNEPLAVGQEPKRQSGVRLGTRRAEARDPAESLEADCAVDDQGDLASLRLDDQRPELVSALARGQLEHAARVGDRDDVAAQVRHTHEMRGGQRDRRPLL